MEITAETQRKEGEEIQNLIFSQLSLRSPRLCGEKSDITALLGGEFLR
jgi:hypothetical protein